jgi:hypothetical protein
MPERESSIINAVRICLLAAVIGYETGVPASAFHYCLEKAFHLHEEVAALSSGSSVNAVLVAALLGAAITAIAVIPVRGFAPEAAGNGIQEIEGVLQGLRNIRIAFEKVTTLYERTYTSDRNHSCARESRDVHGDISDVWKMFPEMRKKKQRCRRLLSLPLSCLLPQ